MRNTFGKLSAFSQKVFDANISLQQQSLCFFQKKLKEKSRENEGIMREIFGTLGVIAHMIDEFFRI